MKKQTQETPEQRFSRKLRGLRMGLAFEPSQRSTASKMGVSHRLYWDWETNGNVTLRSMAKIAAFYGIDVKELL